MAISTLAISFTEIRARLLWELHGQRGTTGLSSDETTNVQSLMDSGLRQFYNAKDWSFLYVELSLPLQSGQDIYEMPEDFGGSVGDLHYSASDNGFGAIHKTTPNVIQDRRSLSSATSGFPDIFTDIPTRSTQSSGQLWHMHFWPSPDGAYTVKGMQKINPLALTDTLEYPYGATEHGETILMACLAAAETQLDGEPGVYSMQYERQLANSVRKDSEGHAPERLGYNGNGDTVPPWLLRQGRYVENYTAVTVD